MSPLMKCKCPKCGVSVGTSWANSFLAWFIGLVIPILGVWTIYCVALYFSLIKFEPAGLIISLFIGIIVGLFCVISAHQHFVPIEIKDA